MNNPLELDSVISSTQDILAQLLVLDRGDVTEHSSIVDDLSAEDRKSVV